MYKNNLCSDCELEDVCKYKSSKISLEKEVEKIYKDSEDIFSPVKVSVECNKYRRKEIKENVWDKV